MKKKAYSCMFPFYFNEVPNPIFMQLTSMRLLIAEQFLSNFGYKSTF